MFQVRPDVLDRVQFGGVSRQAFDVNPSAQTADIFGDDLATVGRKPIPHNEEFAGWCRKRRLTQGPCCGSRSFLAPAVHAGQAYGVRHRTSADRLLSMMPRRSLRTETNSLG